MKNDLFCVRYASERVYLQTWKGSFHPADITWAEERIEEIDEMFIKRFGKQRAKKLFEEMKDYKP